FHSTQRASPSAREAPHRNTFSLVLTRERVLNQPDFQPTTRASGSGGPVGSPPSVRIYDGRPSNGSPANTTQCLLSLQGGFSANPNRKIVRPVEKSKNLRKPSSFHTPSARTDFLDLVGSTPMDCDELHHLLGQARGGDHAAAAALLREFEPALRREARLML